MSKKYCPLLSKIIIYENKVNNDLINFKKLHDNIYLCEIYCPENNNCKFWDDVVNECSQNILHHIHKQHYHQTIHNYNKITKQCGNSSIGQGIANTLLQEFMNNEDLDGNDKIFGKDFALINNSSEPYQLKILRLSPLWKNPKILIDFNDLKLWFNGEGLNPFKDL